MKIQNILYLRRLRKFMQIIFNSIRGLMKPKKRHIFPENPKKIVILRPTDGSIGDCIVGASLLKPLKKKFPYAKIIYVCKEHLHPLLNNYPFVDKVESSVYSINFDDKTICILLEPSSKVARELRQLGAKNLIGFSQFKNGFLLDEYIEIPRTDLLNKNIYDLHFELLKFLKINKVKSTFKVYFKKQIKKKKKLIGFSAGVKEYRPMWPIENYIMLIKKLKKKKYKILFFGSKEELENIKKKLNLKKEEIFFSENLYQVAERIKQCKVFLTYDCGLMHLANACNVKTIAMFAQSNPLVWAPKRVRVIQDLKGCEKCYKKCRERNHRKIPLKCTNKIFIRCMKNITVNKIFKMLTEVQ